MLLSLTFNNISIIFLSTVIIIFSAVELILNILIFVIYYNTFNSNILKKNFNKLNFKYFNKFNKLFTSKFL